MNAAADRGRLMLIHGAWLSSASRDNFAGYFRARGFDVFPPEWPLKEGDVVPRDIVAPPTDERRST